MKLLKQLTKEEAAEDGAEKDPAKISLAGELGDQHTLDKLADAEFKPPASAEVPASKQRSLWQRFSDTIAAKMPWLFRTSKNAE